MMKNYLLSYDNTFGESNDIIGLLKSIDSIRDLRSCMANSCFIKSAQSAKELSAKIIQLFLNSRFLISEISSNRQGWLPKEIWGFIKDEQQ